MGTSHSGEVTPPSGIGQELASDMVAVVPMDKYRRVLNKMTAMREEPNQLCEQVKWMEKTSAADVRHGNNAMMNTRKSLTQTDHRNLVAVKLFCRKIMHCSY